MIRKLAIAMALGSVLAMPVQAETYGVLMKTSQTHSGVLWNWVFVKVPRKQA